MKGIELGTSKRMSEVIVDTAGVSLDRVVIVTGPNLAGEIAQEQPTATVVTSIDPTAGGAGAARGVDPVLPAVHEHRRGGV